MYHGELMICAGIALVAFSLIALVIVCVAFKNRKDRMIRKIYEE